MANANRRVVRGKLRHVVAHVAAEVQPVALPKLHRRHPREALGNGRPTKHCLSRHRRLRFTVRPAVAFQIFDAPIFNHPHGEAHEFLLLYFVLHRGVHGLRPRRNAGGEQQ